MSLVNIKLNINQQFELNLIVIFFEYKDYMKNQITAKHTINTYHITC